MGIVSFEEDLDPPPRKTIEEIQFSIERSLRQVELGQTVDGQVVLNELRAKIDAMKAARRGNDGQVGE